MSELFKPYPFIFPSTDISLDGPAGEAAKKVNIKRLQRAASKISH